MTNLPGGTVTLLFSDIEGSTMLLSRLGPEYADALDAQRAVLRDAWSAHHGIELGTEGDSFYVVFETAPDAVAAAVEAQRAIAVHEWPQGERVRVRMGIHTGSPVPHDGAYVGMDVHRAARIAGAAHGGQIVISAATAELAHAELPAGTSLVDLGSHQLKDIARAERLYQLAGPGMESAFPPLKTLGASTTLPAPATTLVGREADLAELGAALRLPDVRLVTLTGAGGTGKTRLAVGLAHRLTDAFPDGVYFTGLAAVATSQDMWTAIGETMDVPTESRRFPEIFGHIQRSGALLVLDNLEQIEGADEVVGMLLDQAPGLVVVATSRRPLHVAGEQEYAVPTLDLPPDGTAAAAERSGAVQLFVQQARRVRTGFTLTPANAPDVVEICRRLDGLPLALELAAARSKLLGPRALLGRLDQALDIAATSRVPGRQRTLRQTIAWSYDLLPARLRDIFSQLSVFAGGADLPAIEAVVKDPVSRDENAGGDALSMVEELVEASLVRVGEDSDGEPRIGMLETVRSFAGDTLTAGVASARDGVRRRHARHYLGVAQQMKRLFYSNQYLQARAGFETEQANFREALGWSLEPELAGVDAAERVQIGLRLARSVSGFLGAVGAFGEAWQWLDRAAAAAHEVESPDLAQCLQQMARSQRGFGDLDRALELATASVEMWRRVDSAGLPMALNTLGVLESERGNPAAAGPTFEQAMAAARESDNRVHLHQIMGTQATFLESQGDLAGALELNAAALAIANELGDRVSAVIYQHNSACALRTIGRVDEAADVMCGLIPGFLEANEPPLLMVFAEDLASVLAFREPEQAVQLVSAAEGLRERLATPRRADQEGKLAVALASTHAALDEAQWQQAYRAGRDQTIETLVQRHHQE